MATMVARKISHTLGTYAPEPKNGFVGQNQYNRFYEKKIPSLCREFMHGCPNENFVRPIFQRSFQVRHFSFWITEGIGPTGVIFVLLTSGTNSVE
jgi:hypothetical protein